MGHKAARARKQSHAHGEATARERKNFRPLATIFLFYTTVFLTAASNKGNERRRVERKSRI
jgi:hypothetical protein